MKAALLASVGAVFLLGVLPAAAGPKPTQGPPNSTASLNNMTFYNSSSDLAKNAGYPTPPVKVIKHTGTPVSAASQTHTNKNLNMLVRAGNANSGPRLKQGRF